MRCGKGMPSRLQRNLCGACEVPGPGGCPKGDPPSWKVIRELAITAFHGHSSKKAETLPAYLDLGSMIAAKQMQSQWGDKVIPQLSHDLQREFPEIRGLSASNLKYCQRFFHFYSSGGADGASSADITPTPFGQQPVDQIPWGHNILIFTKCGNVAEASFYIAQTIEQGWSRDVLALQLKSNLHARAGRFLGRRFSSRLCPSVNPRNPATAPSLRFR